MGRAGLPWIAAPCSENSVCVPKAEGHWFLWSWLFRKAAWIPVTPDTPLSCPSAKGAVWAGSQHHPVPRRWPLLVAWGKEAPRGHGRACWTCSILMLILQQRKDAVVSVRSMEGISGRVHFPGLTLWGCKHVSELAATKKPSWCFHQLAAWPQSLQHRRAPFPPSLQPLLLSQCWAGSSALSQGCWKQWK